MTRFTAEFIPKAAILLWRSVRQIMIWVLLVPVIVYRWTLSPFIGHHCRFLPTCSEYALVAIQRFGPFRGVWLTAKRLIRCQPLCEGGFDPVPPKHDDSGKGSGK